MKNPKQTIIEILGIINYQNDKEKFADNFIELCIKQAFVEVIDSLPKEKTASISAQIQAAKTPEEFVKHLRSYINPQFLERKIEQTSSKLFNDYIQEILPTLDDSKKLKLMDYIETLGSSTEPI